jgi:F0F1-type ATP synthase assembly protein I
VSNKKQLPNLKKQRNKLVVFSGLAFQMISIISLGVFLGYKIDSYLEISNQIFTIIFSLLFIFISLVYVIQKSKKI